MYCYATKCSEMQSKISVLNTNNVWSNADVRQSLMRWHSAGLLVQMIGLKCSGVKQRGKKKSAQK